MTKMLVCGDRNWLARKFPDGSWDDMLSMWVYDQTMDVLLTVAKAHGVDTVIEGCARGADRCGEDFAEKYPALIPNLLHYPAKWDEHGKSAGPRRNIQMLEEGDPDFVVAFHDNLMESRGTGHMVTIAEKAGVPVFAYSTDILIERSKVKRAYN